MQAKPGSGATSGTAIRTFLIADIRGYTLFTTEHGDEAAARLATRFATLTREGVHGNGGTVIELRGDEALAVFDSARQAIRAAIELQRRFVDETVADPRMPLPVGIGLDAGEAVPVEGGYRGGALNLAARLCALAGPAEILATREVIHVARKVDGVTHVDRGPVRLKGLPDPVHIIRLRAEADDAAEDVGFRRALGPSAARLTPVVPGVMVPNPYKGLRAFEEADAPDFFGREELTQLLVDRLGQTRFLAVVGPSGSGKSSVVRAGLIPALRRGALPGSNDWLIAEMLPGAHPLDELEAGLLRVAANPPSSLIEQLERDDHGLLRAAKRVLPADGSELLLVIDQFEEVFTLVQDEATRTHFLESLEAAVTDPHSRLRVAVTLRADFYDRPLRHRGFAELLRSRVEAVVPLSPEELERAIAGPAKRVDVRLEQGLVAQMLADVAAEPGALPLLEYALTELFERREGAVLTVEAYRAIGGVSGALGRRAEELFGGLADEAEDAARQLFLRLVALGEATEDTRRPVPRSELVSLEVDQPAMATVIDSFGASRLLSFDRDSRTGAPTVEVAHEALLTAWGRLRRWIDEAREDLRTERRLALSAREWLDAGRDHSFLATGSRLDQFETWRQNGAISITPDERDFLEASVAERDRRRMEEEARQARERVLERRSVRRLRALVAVLAATALVATGLTVFAFNQRGRAASEATRAEREARVAIARELAAASVANLDVDPERSILLALEAVDATREADGTVLPEAEEVLHLAVKRSRVIRTVPQGGEGLSVTSDGTRLLTTGFGKSGGTTTVWDLETGERLLVLPEHAGAPTAAFSPDDRLIATGHNDGTARIWDAATGEELHVLRGHEGEVTHPAFSPDGRWLATGGEDATVRIWDVAAGTLEKTLTGHTDLTNSAAFSPDGSRLASASFDATVRIWDTATWKILFTLKGHERGVYRVVFSSDGSRVATAGQEGTARLWDAESGAQLETFFSPSSVEGVAFSPDGTRIATMGSDAVARVWDADNGREELTLAGHTLGLGNVAFTPDGNRLLTASLDGTTRLWDISVAGARDWLTVPGAQAIATWVAFSPDGRWFAAPAEPAGVTIWDTESGAEVRTLVGQDEKLGSVSWSPDGGRLAASSDRTQTPTVWDVRTGELLLRLVGHDSTVRAIAFSSDGRRLVTGSYDKTARVWDSITGKEQATLESSGYVLTVGFSPDGRFVVTGDDRGVIGVWDVVTMEQVRTLSGHQGGVEGIAFSPNGLLFTASSDGTAKVWDLESGEERMTLRGHSSFVSQVDVSPDGTTVATTSDDKTTKLWNLATGRELLTLFGDEIIIGVDFSPDGRLLATASPDGTVALHLLPIEEFRRLARERVTRSLTDEECRQYLHVERCPQA